MQKTIYDPYPMKRPLGQERLQSLSRLLMMDIQNITSTSLPMIVFAKETVSQQFWQVCCTIDTLLNHWPVLLTLLHSINYCRDTVFRRRPVPMKVHNLHYHSLPGMSRSFTFVHPMEHLKKINHSFLKSTRRLSPNSYQNTHIIIYSMLVPYYYIESVRCFFIFWLFPHSLII